VFNQLKEDEFLKLAKEHKRVVVFREVLSDFITPLSAFQALCKEKQEGILLESGARESTVGKYSLIGVNPYLTFEAFSDYSICRQLEKVERVNGNPFDLFQTLLNKHKGHASKELPPLLGGAMGLMSYDSIRHIECIPDQHETQAKLPDLYFQFCELMVFFDHFKGTMTVAVNVEVSNEPFTDYKQAVQKIEAVLLTVQNKEFQRQKNYSYKHEVECDVDDTIFCSAVDKAKDYLYQGDAFQIVLSRSFRTKFHVPPIEIYRALKAKSPAPYMFFICAKDFAVAGASPEKLVSLKEGIIETMPIAGTRPIGSGDENKRLEEELKSDEKEHAEHMMLVDLGRNDIGKISKPGTVKVKELKVLKQFSHVMHLVSIVQGHAEEGIKEVDVLKAVFPAGTLSGAPKVRAMEIIDELEKSRRGIYGGAICVLDGRGNLESCIAIRMAFLKDGIATVRAGAGIVIDSDPQKEADETRSKAKGVLEAIACAEAGNL